MSSVHFPTITTTTIGASAPQGSWISRLVLSIDFYPSFFETNHHVETLRFFMWQLLVLMLCCDNTVLMLWLGSGKKKHLVSVR